MKTSILHPLYDKTYYTAPDITYIISSYIREYDISKANINVLYQKGVINKSQFDYFYNLDRRDRQIQIGLLQKDNPNVANVLKEGIKEMRYLFLSENNLNENDVLSIKNDAMFIVNKIPTVTKFNNIEFVCKNIYTSFYKINGRLELYYLYDMVNNIENIDIKGISDNKLLLHKDYFLEFLLVLFNSAQVDNIVETMDILIRFYEDYINMNLDINYYRQFNADSMFQMKQFGPSCYYKAEFLSNDDKDNIDISFNLNILRELSGIYASIINKNKR